MNRLQQVSAVLLAIPLLGSGLNAMFSFVEPLSGTGYAGEAMWREIRASGLMPWLALGHFTLGIGLLLPRWRFAAGLLQLPVTLGIVVFNLVLFPPGIPLALAMLVFNVLVLADRSAVLRLVEPPQVPDPARHSG